MQKLRCLITSLSCLANGCLLLMACVSSADPARDLQAFAAAYRAGDAEGCTSMMHPQVEEDGVVGRDVARSLYAEMFAEYKTYEVAFANVRVQEEGRFSAWFDARLDDKLCAGTLMVDLAPDGTWRRVVHPCHEPLFSWTSEAGQILDVGSTALALQQGATELNPVVSGALDAGAGPVLIALKLGAGELAENLDTETCHGVETGLSTGGAAFGFGNLAGLVAPACIPCALAAAVGGGMFGYHGSRIDNLRRCQGQYGPVDFALITADGIWRELPDAVVPEPVLADAHNPFLED